jgi:hypothetical protein
MRVQPILNDEVQTFKALITVHKVLQEGHPIVRGVAPGRLMAESNVMLPVDQGSPWTDRLAGDLRSYRWP